VSFGIDQGVMVKNMEQSGKLKAIGIGEGFIILKVNDKEVSSQNDIEKILKNHKGRVSVSYVDPYGRIYRRGFTMDSTGLCFHSFRFGTTQKVVPFFISLIR